MKTGGHTAINMALPWHCINSIVAKQDDCWRLQSSATLKSVQANQTLLLWEQEAADLQSYRQAIS